MISYTLATMSDELVRAAGRRQYAEVQRLAMGVGVAAAREARALPSGDPVVREIAAWLKDLFNRTEILLRVARASQAAELRRATFLQRYLKPPDRPMRHVVGSY